MKDNKAPRLNHLMPIPFEAQQAQSEYLLEQFDKQEMDFTRQMTEPYVIFSYGAEGQCPQVWVEVLVGPIYQIPSYKHDGQPFAHPTVTRRSMIEFRDEYYDYYSNEEDNEAYWVVDSDSSCRWPLPLLGDDINLHT